MSKHGVTESLVEDVALDLLETLGWSTLHGAENAPGSDAPERESYETVVLEARLRAVVERLNPKASATAIDEAVRRT